MENNIYRYYESWSHELAAKANRVRDLIGSAHWLTDGQHKEEILKSHLRKYLPAGLNVTRGFIVDPTKKDTVSKEIDILITDNKSIPPLLFEDDLIISLPSAVIGQIEVKTTFSKANLYKALVSSAHNQSIVNTRNLGAIAWQALFFYQSEPDIDALDFINESVEKLLENSNDVTVTSKCIPKVIIIMGHSVTFVTMDSPSLIKIKMFPSMDISAAIGFIDLFSNLSESLTLDQFWDFSNISESLDIPQPSFKEITLKS
jgi:hypothetical protein